MKPTGDRGWGLSEGLQQPCLAPYNQLPQNLYRTNSIIVRPSIDMFRKTPNGSNEGE